jgi:hypothetical protein
MTENNGPNLLSEERRRELFRALVEAQDRDGDVAQSRRMVSKHFGVTEGQVREIEREGLDRQWPPLAEEPGLA